MRLSSVCRQPLAELKGALRYHRTDAARLGDILRIGSVRLGVDPRVGVGPTTTVAVTVAA